MSLEAEICIISCWSRLLQSNRIREHEELIYLPLLLKEVTEFVPGSAEIVVELVNLLYVIVGGHPFQILQPGHHVTQVFLVLVL